MWILISASQVLYQLSHWTPHKEWKSIISVVLNSMEYLLRKLKCIRLDPAYKTTYFHSLYLWHRTRNFPQPAPIQSRTQNIGNASWNFRIYTVRHKLSITRTLFQKKCLCINFFKRTNSLLYFVTLVFLWSAEQMRMSFGRFAEFLRCPAYTNPYFGVYP